MEVGGVNGGRHTHSHTHKPTHTRPCTNTHIYKHTHVNIQTDTHTYLHTHTHVCPACSSSSSSKPFQSHYILIGILINKSLIIMRHETTPNNRGGARERELLSLNPTHKLAAASIKIWFTGVRGAVETFETPPTSLTVSPASYNWGFSLRDIQRFDFFFFRFFTFSTYIIESHYLPCPAPITHRETIRNDGLSSTWWVAMLHWLHSPSERLLCLWEITLRAACDVFPPHLLRVIIYFCFQLQRELKSLLIKGHLSKAACIHCACYPCKLLSSPFKISIHHSWWDPYPSQSKLTL